MKYLYAPGCALMCYKPTLSDRLKNTIVSLYGEMDNLLSCCFNAAQSVPEEVCIITPCTTCHRNYQKKFPQAEVHWFLEELAESQTFDFPDYGGAEMSIQDTCSARTDERYLSTIRRLLQRMNIRLVEPKATGKGAKCCGQIFYDKLPIGKVETYMKKRAEEMPVTDVVVYCASCIQAMSVGGRRPRYILDLLFNEPTAIVGNGVVSWNNSLRDFRNTYK